MIKKPNLSNYYQTRKVSVIRSVYEKLKERKDIVVPIDMALGNINRAMYPALIKRMRRLAGPQSPFNKGIVKYSSSAGYVETQKAFLKIFNASDLPIDNLYIQITDGASQAIEFCLLGISGNTEKNIGPILLFDPAYTSFEYMARRLNRRTISMVRIIQSDGIFEFPSIKKIEQFILKKKPNAMIIIPYDNPTGQLITQNQLEALARLCVRYNMWLVSDETYRELHYSKSKAPSIWRLSDETIPGIQGRRISLESASKVWNACGLRIGAIVTDNETFYEKSVAESTANVCPNVIGQYIFSALAKENKKDIKCWFDKQREYYQSIISFVSCDLKKKIPSIIISKPDAALYLVLDFKNIDPNFNAIDFINFCAKSGKSKYGNQYYTVLMTPLENFFKDKKLGRTMVRISFMDSINRIRILPNVLKDLLDQYFNTK
ncbi:MAG: aminotransferase class I/II-fold pyridoxal phosphate-dependent enzyme [Candidatus Paceibacterota bacterium]